MMRDFSLDDINKLIWDSSTYNPIGVPFLDNRYQEHIDRGGK